MLETDAIREMLASKVSALSDELWAAREEVARLNGRLRWEENRAGRIGTHGPGCWAWGPTHFECALSRIEELLAENERLKVAARAANRDIEDAYAEGRAEEAEAAEGDLFDEEDRK